MNTCIKCGCDDAYPSLPPCPTPVDCPNPQPCAEFFNAQCVRYTLPDIMCGLNIVVAQDSSIADALESIVLFFCTNFSNSVQSVTGLNTDNTDPLNPIVKISVDGITITGLGTPASPLIAVGGVDGSGIIDYVARWTPDATTLGTGVIRDNGSTVGIGSAPNAVAQLYVSSAVGGIVGITTTSGYQGVVGTSNGVGVGTNSGVKGSAAFGAVNAAVEGRGTSGVGTVAYGGWFTATGVGSNYSLKLQDGTQGSGRFLKSITANGEANWADITAADVSGVVGGSGTLNYLSKWTPDGSTLGNSLIRDDGTTIGIGIAPSSNALLNVSNASNNVAVRIDQLLNATATTNGAYITNTGINTQENRGLEISVSNSSLINTGLLTVVTANAPAVGTGGTFIVTGTSLSKYALRLQDGTEAPGKVLTCITANGEANWVTPSGVAGSGTNNYVARWTPDGATLGNSLIRDDGSRVAINADPSADTSKTFFVQGLSSTLEVATFKSNYTASGARGVLADVSQLNTFGNTGFYGIARNSSSKNIGGQFLADNNGAGGLDYSVKLQDGTQGIGKVLTDVTGSGEANWVTLPTIGGLTWSTITGNNPTATLAANNGYVIKNTIGGGTTDLTLPSSGVVVGDIIKISATKAGGGGFLQTWRILEGSTTDIIFYSFYDITSDSEITGLKNTSPLLTFDDNVSGSYTVFKNQSLTLTCVEDLGTGYAWNLELANGKVIS